MADVLAGSMVGGTCSTEDDSMMSRIRLRSPNLRHSALLFATDRSILPLTMLLPLSMVQNVGQATAVGIVVDAVIVRTLLFPAIVPLMGKWNWWVPSGVAKIVGVEQA
jgi:hypothetical protein